MDMYIGICVCIFMYMASLPRRGAGSSSKGWL